MAIILPLPAAAHLVKLKKVRKVLFFFFQLCCTACRISVPQPGTEPAPWQLMPGILTTWPPGNSHHAVQRVLVSGFTDRLQGGIVNKTCAYLHRSHKWCCCVVFSCSVFATPWTVACQAPPSMGNLQARILEWVAMPSSRASSQPRDQTWVSRIIGGFFIV